MQSEKWRSKTPTLRQLCDDLIVGGLEAYLDVPIVMSKDDEGNQYKPFSNPTIEKVDGQPVLCLWPGWPEVELDYESEDEGA
jgi:hypothetical protein